MRMANGSGYPFWPAPEKVDGSKVEFWGVEGRQNEHEEESIQ